MANSIRLHPLLLAALILLPGLAYGVTTQRLHTTMRAAGASTATALALQSQTDVAAAVEATRGVIALRAAAAVEETGVALATAAATSVAGRSEAQVRQTMAAINVTGTAVGATEQARQEIYNNIAIAQAVAATDIARPTVIPTVTLATPATPMLNVIVQGCGMSIDPSRRNGEVAVTYVTVENVGTEVVDDVIVYALATDPGTGRHPDQAQRIQHFPAQQERTFVLTVDTLFNRQTGVMAGVIAPNGVYEVDSRSDCSEIDPGTIRQVADILGRFLQLGTRRTIPFFR